MKRKSGPPASTIDRSQFAASKPHPYRDSHYSPKVHKKILKLIRGGNYASTAACVAGVPRAKFGEWRGDYNKRGEDSRFYQLFKDIEEAEADAESFFVALFEAHAVTDPRSVERMLSRRFSKRREERWVDVSVQELQGEVRTGGDATREALVKRLEEIESRRKKKVKKKKKRTKKKKVKGTG